MADEPGPRPGRRTVGPTDLIRAGVELGIARLRLGKFRSRDVFDEVARGQHWLNSTKLMLVDRVAYLIPRVAARLPWRADCLVQALAAQRWLASHNIATSIQIGVPRDPRVQFEAHAWLIAGDRVVTGGDIDRYIPFRI